MTLATLLRDARRDCATLTRGQRFDRWLRVWRPGGNGPAPQGRITPGFAPERLAEDRRQAVGRLRHRAGGRRGEEAGPHQEEKTAQRKRDAAWTTIDRIDARIESQK